MYQNDPMKVLTGEVRLSYVHLAEPYVNSTHPNAKPKYSVTLPMKGLQGATALQLSAEASRETWQDLRRRCI